MTQFEKLNRPNAAVKVKSIERKMKKYFWSQIYPNRYHQNLKRFQSFDRKLIDSNESNRLSRLQNMSNLRVNIESLITVCNRFDDRLTRFVYRYSSGSTVARPIRTWLSKGLGIFNIDQFSVLFLKSKFATFKVKLQLSNYNYLTISIRFSFTFKISISFLRITLNFKTFKLIDYLKLKVYNYSSVFENFGQG